MLVLGIETSAELCSVAWVMDGQILLEYNVEKPNIHTQLLADLVREGFVHIGKTARDLDLICVASGPGSFTGLRIGMAYAKGIAYALEKPIISVTNFEVLAQKSVIDKFPVYTVVDARRGNYFFGIFEKDLFQISDMKFCTENELINDISESGQIVTTIKSFEKKIKVGANIIVTHYSAATLARIAETKYLKEQVSEDIIQMEPLYLRQFAGAT